MDRWLVEPDVWFEAGGGWRKGKVNGVSLVSLAEAKYKFLVRDLLTDDEVEVECVQGPSNEFDMVKRRDAFLDEGVAALELRDLTQLTHLCEPELLDCLHKRFKANCVYTATGPILLAVNPCKELPDKYSPALLETYYQQGQGSVSPITLPPHIYKISDCAYHSMFIDRFSPDQRENQTILINGESGSGKTESLKHCLHYLAVVSSKAATNLGLDSDSSSIENQIIASNPISESLGNAKTSRNNNSSRFGKFVNLYYCADGVIQSASLQTYLLETVRLVSQNSEDRTFHIFHEIAAGMPLEDSQRTGLIQDIETDPSIQLERFAYISPSSSEEPPEVKLKQQQVDADNFYLFCEALDALDFSSEWQRTILDIVVAVLHIGNLTFVESNKACEESALFSPACMKDHLPYICSALAVSADSLLTAVAKRSFNVKGAITVRTITVRDAMRTKDAFAKALYALLFDTVLLAVNSRLSGKNAGSGSRPAVAATISLLDIFGFEYFENNSFEQLCINYANEKLQDRFNETIFRLEQNMYYEEGLDWVPIKYPDNSRCIDLFENKAYGIFLLCNDRTKLKSTVTHETLSNDIYAACSKHERFEATAAHKRNYQFAVKHFAADVLYNTENFIEKNKSEVAQEFKQCLLSSECEFVRYLVFDNENISESDFDSNSGNKFHTPMHLKTPVMKNRTAAQDSTPIKSTPLSISTGEQVTPLISTSLSRSNSRYGTPLSPMRVSSPIGSATRGIKPGMQRSPKVMSLTHRHRARNVTVLAQFSQQLRELMATVGKTRSHFIRCIKPNIKLSPIDFDHQMVLSQLHCGGVLSAVEVFRAGFPKRFEFMAFVNKFSALVYPPGSNPLTHDFYDIRNRAKVTCSEFLWRMTCVLLFRIVPQTELILSLIESNLSQGGSLQLRNVLETARASWTGNGMRIGKSRVFLRSETFDYLENLLHRTRTFVAKIVQKKFRLSHMVRSTCEARYNGEDKFKIKKIGVAIEKFTSRTRISVNVFIKSSIILQRRSRVFVLVRKLFHSRQISIWLSSHYRGYKCRVQVYEHRVAQVTRIQASWRGHIQCTCFRRRIWAIRQLQKWTRHVIGAIKCKQFLERISHASTVLNGFKAVYRGWSVRIKFKSALAELESARRLHAEQLDSKKTHILDILVKNLSNNDEYLNLLYSNLDMLEFDNVKLISLQRAQRTIDDDFSPPGIAMNPMHNTSDCGDIPSSSIEEVECLRRQVKSLEKQVNELQQALQKGRKHFFGCC